MKNEPDLKFDSKSNPGMVRVVHDGDVVGFICKKKPDNPKKVPAYTHHFISTGDKPAPYLAGPDYVSVREQVRKHFS